MGVDVAGAAVEEEGRLAPALVLDRLHGDPHPVGGEQVVVAHQAGPVGGVLPEHDQGRAVGALEPDHVDPGRHRPLGVDADAGGAVRLPLPAVDADPQRAPARAPAHGPRRRGRLQGGAGHQVAEGVDEGRLRLLQISEVGVHQGAAVGVGEGEEDVGRGHPRGPVHQLAHAGHVLEAHADQVAADDHGPGGAVVQEQGVGIQVIVDALGAVVAGPVPAHGVAGGRGDPRAPGASQQLLRHLVSPAFRSEIVGRSNDLLHLLRRQDGPER